jgi:hypothetical protein
VPRGRLGPPQRGGGGSYGWHLLEHDVLGKALSQRVLQADCRLVPLPVHAFRLPRCREAVLQLMLELALYEHVPVELCLQLHLALEVHLLVGNVLLELGLHVGPALRVRARPAARRRRVRRVLCCRASGVAARTTLLRTLLHEQSVLLKVRLDVLPRGRALALAVHQL